MMKNNKTIKFKGAHFNRSLNFSFVYFSPSEATAAILAATRHKAIPNPKPKAPHNTPNKTGNNLTIQQSAKSPTKSNQKPATSIQ